MNSSRKKHWMATLATLLALLPVAALARIGMSPKTATGTINWSGGAVSQNYDFCVTSVGGNSKKSTNVIPYAINATVSGASPFVLTNGANNLPVSLSWQDLSSGGTTTLSPNVTTAETFTGAISGCPSGNNGRLVLNIANSDLVAAVPGTYTQTFSVNATNSGGGKPQAAINVTITLTIPDSIQLTQVNDINLGTFDGINNINATDTLCVYRRGGGLYGLTVTGSGPGGAFDLTSGSSSIPFTVTWNDGAGAITLTPGTLVSGLTNTYTGDPYCSGGAADNATLGVQVLASDILSAASTTGVHTATLTITVQMQ